MNSYFWILWGFDAAAALVVLYFFFTGLADESVSSFNMGLWMAILAGLGSILLGSIFLRNAEKPALANVLLWVLALPALFYLLFILLAITKKGRWN